MTIRTIGIIGGGQLGRMFCMAAQSLGYRTCVLDPAADSPAGRIAERHLQADYTARLGAMGAKKAIDSLSVGMANEYGQGHPWMGCGQLKGLTQELADTGDRARLLAVANEVLGEAAVGGTVIAVRR